MCAACRAGVCCAGALYVFGELTFSLGVTSAYVFVGTPEHAHGLRALKGVAWVGSYAPTYASRRPSDVVQSVHDVHRHHARTLHADMVDSTGLPHARLLVTIATPTDQGGVKNALPSAGTLCKDWAAAWEHVSFDALTPSVIRALVPVTLSTATPSLAALAEFRHAADLEQLVLFLREQPLVQWVDAAAPMPTVQNKHARWNTQGMELMDDNSAHYGACNASCLADSGTCSTECRVPACHFDPVDCYDSTPSSPFTDAGLNGTGACLSCCVSRLHFGVVDLLLCCSRTCAFVLAVLHHGCVLFVVEPVFWRGGETDPSRCHLCGQVNSWLLPTLVWTTVGVCLPTRLQSLRARRHLLPPPLWGAIEVLRCIGA